MNQPQSQYFAHATFCMLGLLTILVTILLAHYKPHGKRDPAHEAERKKNNLLFFQALIAVLALCSLGLVPMKWLFEAFDRQPILAIVAPSQPDLGQAPYCPNFRHDLPEDPKCAERAFRHNKLCVVPGDYGAVTSGYHHALLLYCTKLEADDLYGKLPP